MGTLALHAHTTSHKHTYTPTCRQVVREKHLSLHAIKWSCSLFVEFVWTLQKEKEHFKRNKHHRTRGHPEVFKIQYRVSYVIVFICCCFFFYWFIFYYRKPAINIWKTGTMPLNFKPTDWEHHYYFISHCKTLCQLTSFYTLTFENFCSLWWPSLLCKMRKTKCSHYDSAPKEWRIFLCELKIKEAVRIKHDRKM